MNEHFSIRSWTGVRDSVHPLSRAAHSAVSHGRFIYVLNGYTPTENGMVLFDRSGLTRYDILNNMVYFLPLHWDYQSLYDRSFTESCLVTSGTAVALCPETDQHPAYVYTFAGFSILGNIHINALSRITLPATNKNDSTKSFVGGKPIIQLRPRCCHASVISGQGLLSYILLFPSGNLILQALIYTTLQALKRQISNYSQLWYKSGDNSNSRHHLLPSPRDKLCMEYWNGKLYAFGGYGPLFVPPSSWPNRILQWPFLYDPNDTEQWILCDNNGGWNSQLIIYDINTNCWDLITKSRSKGQPPSPRAAHTSTLLPRHRWIIIFGGRGPNNNSQSSSSSPLSNENSINYTMGRLNDMYCLNLRLLEWTRILTPIDLPNPVDNLQFIWPCGRSWMNMTLFNESSLLNTNSQCYYTEKYLNNSILNQTNDTQLFILGGWSNTDEALNDAYVLQIHLCSKHQRLESRVSACTKQINTHYEYNHHNNNNNLETNHNIHHLHPTNIPKPYVINGFKCCNQFKKIPTSILYADKNGNLNSEKTYNSDIEQQFIDETRTNIMNKNRDEKLFLENLNYLLSIYQQLNFSPNLNNINFYLDQNKSYPKQAFYRIAYVHTNLINYLLKYYCLIINKPNILFSTTTTTSSSSSSSSSAASNTTTTFSITTRENYKDLNFIQKYDSIIDELDNLSKLYLNYIQSSTNNILFLLIRIFLKFLYPWQLLQMLLEETNVWINLTEQNCLIHKLCSDLKYLFTPNNSNHNNNNNSSSSSSSSSDHDSGNNLIQIDLSEQLIIDKLMLLLSPNKIHLPTVLSNQITMRIDSENLLNFIYYLMGTIFTWSNKSPVHYTIDNLSALPNPALIYTNQFLWDNNNNNETDELICVNNEPLKRHWHTVTCGLDKCIYVLGGNDQDALINPIECYHLIKPSSLTTICLKQITKLILPPLLIKTIQNIPYNCLNNLIYSSSSSSSSSSNKEIGLIKTNSSIILTEELNCSNELHKDLENIINESVKSMLLNWLI